MNSRTKVLWLTAIAMLVAFLGFSPTQLAFAGTTWGGDATFAGVITSLPNTPHFVGDWKVNLRTVHVITTTQIITTDGRVAVGSYVEVTGVPQPDGSITALKIEVKAGPEHPDLHARFMGIVKALPGDPRHGDWIVTTQMMTKTIDVTVHVSSTTKIILMDGVTLTVGANVKVDGLLLPDKSVRAGEIDVLASAPPPGKRIEFFGRILGLPISMPVGIWLIGPYTVNVTTTTQINNDGKPIKVGDFAQVDGILLPNGSVDARAIEIHHSNPTLPPKNYIKFYGAVTLVPTTTNHVGDWTVNSITVHVSTTTQINLHGGPFPATPFRAEVKGILNSDGTVDAIQIEIYSPTSLSAPSGLGRASAVARTTE